MILVAAAVIVDNNRLLIAQRAKADKLSLKWEFPGGKLEAAETIETCLKREIMEELNLEIEVSDYIGKSYYQGGKNEICLIAHRARIIAGDIMLNVHNDARWVSLQELDDYSFAPADIDLVEIIKKGTGLCSLF